MVDLNDTNIQGGRMDSTTAGVNWYPNNHLKFMLNYSLHQLDRHAAYPDSNPQFLLLRMQATY
jgi:phosphate-selective porin OprO/OprP